MRAFQFLVRCVFVVVPGIGSGCLHGCFTTITVQGASPKSAASQVPALLKQRMSESGVGAVADGLCRTQCVIDEIWELANDSSDGVQGSGFSFFKIGAAAKFTIIINFWWIRLSKPHMLIDL